MRGTPGAGGNELDEGELRAAGDLEHVQVTIAVAGVEGLDRRGDQEVALAGVADTFAASGAAGSVDLVHGMRHVIGERGLIEVPGLVRRLRMDRGHRQRKQENCEQRKSLHRPP